jgi:hypothetical protein
MAAIISVIAAIAFQRLNLNGPCPRKVTDVPDEEKITPSQERRLL